ncbi:MAG TPA: ABC transporter permease [Myxococcales bacterium]|jgi:putative ABC transport system permease protein
MTALIDTIALALATLRSNPLRSLLTLLGIVIGAATVVAMMSLTEGLRVKVETDLAMLGAGALHVAKYPAIGTPGMDWNKYRKRKSLTLEDARAVAENCPHVKRVSPERFSFPPEKLSTKERATRPNIWVGGVQPEYEPVNGYEIAQGRFISEVDVALARRVVVIGADVADALFPHQSPLGETVRIRSAPYTVIGVLERMGTILGLASKDTIAVVPLPAFDADLGKSHEMELGVQAITPDQMRIAEDELVGQLRRTRKVAPNEENDFEVFSNESMTSMFNNLAATIAAATFGVCALALLVGGIGIMNIMLVSVVERTREIGIRKALGARRRRVLSQFVVEAVVLSLIGGLLGVGLGATVAIFAREVYGVPASVPVWAVLLALSSASGCGLVFGIYPAVRASRLDPVEAMRAE